MKNSKEVTDLFYYFQNLYLDQITFSQGDINILQNTAIALLTKKQGNNCESALRVEAIFSLYCQCKLQNHPKMTI